MKRAFIVSIAAFAGLLPGCFRTRTERPSTLVNFASSRPDIRIFDVSMDGEPLLFGGVEKSVPAGAHDFRLRFEKESRVCNEGEPFCNLVRKRGECRLLGDTKAGKLYDAILTENADQYFISLADSALRGEEIAKSECRLTEAETRIEVTR